MNGRREGWPMNTQELEQRWGFRLPAGVEIREDQHLVYVYADGQVKAVAVLSAPAATPPVIAEAVQKAVALKR